MEPITIGIVCSLLGWGIKKITDWRKEGTKREKIKAKSDIEIAKIKAAQDNIKKAKKEQNDWKEKYEAQEKANEQIKKDLESAKNKANDSSLSEEERATWRRKAADLEDQYSQGSRKSQSYLDKIAELTEIIKKNEDILASVKSSNLNEGYELQDFLNMETAMIVIALYIGYQLLLKDDRK